MPRRQWTLVIVPDDHSGIRQYRVSRKVFRRVIGGGAALLLVLSVLAIGFFVKERQRMRAERLARDNALLVQEVEDVRERMTSLQEWMDEMARRDDQYRLVAGLEPIDGDVQQAGIGGPGTETLQSNPLWRSNPELGELTFSTAYDLNTLVRRARMLSRSWDDATDSLEATHDRWTTMPSIQPTRGYVSSGFSHRRWHPILNRPRPHEGVDITARIGTPIFAAADGRVTYSGRRGQYGEMIEVEHGHGIVTRYAHASELLVRRGERVERGQKIAEVGQTGLAAGPHVHYEVLVDGRPQNPSKYMFGEAIPD